MKEESNVGKLVKVSIGSLSPLQITAFLFFSCKVVVKIVSFSTNAASRDARFSTAYIIDSGKQQLICQRTYPGPLDRTEAILESCCEMYLLKYHKEYLGKYHRLVYIPNEFITGEHLDDIKMSYIEFLGYRGYSLAESDIVSFDDNLKELETIGYLIPVDKRKKKDRKYKLSDSGRKAYVLGAIHRGDNDCCYHIYESVNLSILGY